jgi:hypothetical protein
MGDKGKKEKGPSRRHYQQEITLILDLLPVYKSI